MARCRVIGIQYRTQPFSCATGDHQPVPVREIARSWVDSGDGELCGPPLRMLVAQRVGQHQRVFVPWLGLSRRLGFRRTTASGDTQHRCQSIRPDGRVVPANSQFSV